MKPMPEEGSFATSLRVTHFHVKVVDLDSTLAWFERICDVRPAFRIPRLAYLTLGAVTLVLEPGPTNTEITIAFGTTDCDGDFALLANRGARPIAPPVSQPWGIRGAYFEGPAGITFEIEQRIEACAPVSPQVASRQLA